MGEAAVNIQGVGSSVKPGSAPYLDTVSSHGGVGVQTPVVAASDNVENLEIMKELWHRSQLCGKVANKFYGVVSGKKYYKFMPCLKWWCNDCGKKKGRINVKRTSRVLDRIKLDPKNTLMRQAVFTVPAADTAAFKSRDALGALIRMAERVIRKMFPGLPCVATLHLFGDKGGIRWHPHVHIVIIDKRGQALMLPPEFLEQMRESWRRALQAYVLHPVKTINVHISFIEEYGRMIHRIRYLTRPMPGPHHYHKLKKDLDLLYFCMVVMKGFMFVRYFNGCRMKGVKDPVPGDVVQECQGVAGEALFFVLHGQISREDFNSRYGVWNTDELAPGFYRVRGP